MDRFKVNYIKILKRIILDIDRKNEHNKYSNFWWITEL